MIRVPGQSYPGGCFHAFHATTFELNQVDANLALDLIVYIFLKMVAYELRTVVFDVSGTLRPLSHLCAIFSDFCEQAASYSLLS